MTRILLKNEFAQDFITRSAGDRLRRRILDASKTGGTTVVDFSGLIVGSISFLDEGLAALSEAGWTAEQVERRILLKDIYHQDLELLNRLTRDRWKPTSKIPTWTAEVRDDR